MPKSLIAALAEEKAQNDRRWQHALESSTEQEQPTPKPWHLFRKKRPEPTFTLRQFNTDLYALIDRAIAARIHRKDIADALENASVQQNAAWSMSAPL
jgi:hypothetical protein